MADQAADESPPLAGLTPAGRPYRCRPRGERLVVTVRIADGSRYYDAAPAALGRILERADQDAAAPPAQSRIERRVLAALPDHFYQEPAS